MDTMTTDHPRWEEFANRLEGPEACNFRKVDGQTTWTCKPGKEDRPFARAILKDMGMDVGKSLAYFYKRGGICCDCEILFNVIPRVVA